MDISNIEAQLKATVRHLNMRLPAFNQHGRGRNEKQKPKPKPSYVSILKKIVLVFTTITAFTLFIIKYYFVYEKQFIQNALKRNPRIHIDFMGKEQLDEYFVKIRTNALKSFPQHEKERLVRYVFSFQPKDYREIIDQQYENKWRNKIINAFIKFVPVVTTVSQFIPTSYLAKLLLETTVKTAVGYVGGPFLLFHMGKKVWASHEEDIKNYIVGLFSQFLDPYRVKFDDVLNNKDHIKNYVIETVSQILINTMKAPYTGTRYAFQGGTNMIKRGVNDTISSLSNIFFK